MTTELSPAQQSWLVFSRTIAVVQSRLAPNEATIVVDGTQYSPSTRAVPGAEHVYQTATSDEWIDFDEEFNEFVEAYESEGYFLVWDDGCLSLCGPEYFNLP
jgi:hypothetical protein